MNRKTGNSNAIKIKVLPYKDPKDQKLVLNSSEMVAIVLKFLQSLSEEQWKEVNEAVFDKGVKRKVAKMCDRMIKFITDAVIQIVRQPTCTKAIKTDTSCCALTEQFKCDIVISFESSLSQALKEIGGVDSPFRISPLFSQAIVKSVIHKVSAALPVKSTASLDSDSSSMVVPTNKKRFKLAGAVSTMKSFLTGHVTTVRKQITKRERAEAKKARKEKKKMSLWKRTVLKMHKRKVQSVASEDSSDCSLSEEEHPSDSSASPTNDSCGDPLRAAADPEEEVHTSESTGSSSGASEKTIQTMIIQVSPFEDPEEKNKAEAEMKLRNKDQTEQPQSQSLQSDPEEEVHTSESTGSSSGASEKTIQTMIIQVSPFEDPEEKNKAEAEMKLRNKDQTEQPQSQSLQSDPEEEVHTSESTGSSSGASEKTIQTMIIQVSPFEDPEEKNKAEAEMKLRNKDQTEQPQSQSLQCDLEDETATTVDEAPKEKSIWERCKLPRKRNRVQPAPVADFDSPGSLSCGDLFTILSDEQQQPSCSVTVCLPDTSDLRSDPEVITPTESNQSFTGPKEDSRSTPWELEDYVEEETKQDESGDSPLTTVEPIPTDEKAFEATDDSQEKMTTFLECQPDDHDNNVTSAIKDSDTTEKQAKSKKGFFSSLRSLFKRDKKKNKSKEKKEENTKNPIQKLFLLCCTAVE